MQRGVRETAVWINVFTFTENITCIKKTTRRQYLATREFKASKSPAPKMTEALFSKHKYILKEQSFLIAQLNLLFRPILSNLIAIFYNGF